MSNNCRLFVDDLWAPIRILALGEFNLHCTLGYLGVIESILAINPLPRRLLRSFNTIFETCGCERNLSNAWKWQDLASLAGRFCISLQLSFKFVNCEQKDCWLDAEKRWGPAVLTGAGKLWEQPYACHVRCQILKQFKSQMQFWKLAQKMIMKDLIVKERKGFPISLKGFSKLSTSTNLGDAYKIYTFTYK